MRSDRERPGRLGALVTRRPWRVVLTAAVIGVAGVVLGGPVAGLLAPGGFADPSSEDQVAERRLAAASGVDAHHNVVVLIRPGVPVTDPVGQAEVARVDSQLRADPAIGAVVDAAVNPAQISRDGRSSYLVGELRPMSEKAEKDVATRLKSAFAGDPAVELGGYLLANDEVQGQVSSDLGRAEALAAIVLVPLMIVVFRGAVAALLPLMVGLLTVVTTLLWLRAVNSLTDLSIFALNLVIGLGLGLAIDYSLLMVSRYREEARGHGHGHTAVRATLATAGRTVVFSSLTVAAAMASLLVFPLPFLYSMGIGGILVVTSAAVIALTLLPAVLTLLGPRLDALAVRRAPSAAEHQGGWYRLAATVMRRPGRVAIATGALLLVLGTPFLGIRFTSVDPSVLPASASARQVFDSLHRDFAADTTTPATLQISAPQSAAPAVAALAQQVRALPGAAAVTPPRYLGADTWTLDALSGSPFLSQPSKDLVNGIRGLHSGLPVRVSGATAQFIDLQSSLRDHLPLGIAIVAVVTVLVLFALTGSAVLPLKALAMNALSLSAAFGVLVFVFQDGRLTGLLDYTGQGALESTQPILLFALAFGLSTDYGVFLLSRIKEHHDAGLPTTEAVALGLERTGRVVTAAALLFCVAIGAFASSSIVFIKELGVGTAAAVVIDASIVRALLVPSLMALLGDWNWWAPRPLRRLWRKLRLDRLEGAPARA